MTNSPHSESKTEGIRIYAAAEYMPQEVLPAEFRGVTQLPNAGLQQAQGDGQDPLQSFVFRYKITMSNEGDLPARLLSRHWVIVDGEGQREEVRGRGVVNTRIWALARATATSATARCIPPGARWKAPTRLSAKMVRASMWRLRASSSCRRRRRSSLSRR